MGEQAESAAGYHVIWGTSYIGETVDPKMPDETRNMVDNTTHDALAANGGYETKSKGTITQSDGSIKIYYIGSTVHKSLRTDFLAGTERTVYFIRPSGGALAFTCKKCTAIISKMSEPIDKKGNITWELAITPTSGQTDVETAAAGLTTPFFAIADDDTPANAITPVPAAAAAVYAYEVELYSDNATFTVTPTAAVGSIYVDGTVVVSGAASGAITSPAAGKKKYLPIVVFETSKCPKPYLLIVKRGPVAKPV
ncbi:MAG: hypothetical protein M0Q92_02800 [Methanoregula sp.]|jgi:hypothetical protein|nr:hypothetical protein [Methanoregula sp.]